MVDLAKKHGIMDGKWMILVNWQDAEKVWQSLAKSLLRGELKGVSAVRISPSEPSLKNVEGRHKTKISVCSQNFQDQVELRAIKSMITEQICKYEKLCYKPEIMSILDLNNRNKWNIKVTEEI